MKTPVKIRVDLSTRKALKALGRKGETYDSIIRSLIEDSRLYREVLGNTAMGDLHDVEEEVRER